MSQHSTLSLGQRLVRSTGLQLILVAGSFSLLTYTLGRNSGIQESEVHRTNLSITEIREQLSGKLRVPMFLNDLNASAIDAQPDLLKNFDALGRRFWHQLKAFPVDYINYGAPDGSFLGLERGSDDDVLALRRQHTAGAGPTDGVLPLSRWGTPRANRDHPRHECHPRGSLVRRHRYGWTFELEQHLRLGRPARHSFGFIQHAPV